MTAHGRLSVRRLESAAAVADAFRGLGAAPIADAAPAHGLVVEAGASAVLVVGLARAHPRLVPTPARGVALVATPFAVAPTAGADAVRAAATVALRELIVAEHEWHALRLVGAPEPVVDAAWRLASALGHACAVTQDPPPTRTADGSASAGPVVVTLYSPRLKGRWLRGADAGVGAVLGAAVRERVGAIAVRSSPATAADEGGSRFFALDLAAVPAAPSWEAEVTFREVEAREAEAEPLRYCTGVRRLHEALRRGDRCFATYVDATLAHTHWVSTDDAFLRRVLPARALDRRIGHPFDSYTLPAFRGRRLQGVTHHWLALRYRDEGIVRFVVRITATNAASIRGVQKAGYVELPGD